MELLSKQENVQLQIKSHENTSEREIHLASYMLEKKRCQLQTETKTK